MKEIKEIAQLWDKIEQSLAVYAPEIANGLYPGTSLDQIAAAERELGITFPDDFKASYLIHNGQPREHGLFDGWSLRSLESIIRKWRSLKADFDSGVFQSFPSQLNGLVRAEWWHPGWIPFTDNWSGDGHCIDFVPTENGQLGQIFRYWHDAPERIWLAPNFTIFLAQFADDLAQGRYRYSSSTGLELIEDP